MLGEKQKLIYAGPLEQELENLANSYRGTFSGTAFAIALEKVQKASAVDAIEVVRCKDCKHLYSGMDDYCCKSHRGLVRICENSFCSYGERKNNE